MQKMERLSNLERREMSKRLSFVLIFSGELIIPKDCAMEGLTTNVMAQMGKDKPITFKNLERICKALDCTPNDVFSFDDKYVE